MTELAQQVWFKTQFTALAYRLLVRSVIGVVAIGRWRILHSVENETDDVRRLELMLRALRNGVAGDALASDEKNGVAGAAHADGVGHGDDGRGIDDDPVEAFTGDAQQLFKARAARKISGAVTHAAAGDEHEVIVERRNEA